jgi:flagellar hook-associated protein 2
MLTGMKGQLGLFMTMTYLPTFYGIDFSKVLNSSLTVTSQPLQLWQSQQQGLQAEDTATMSLIGLVSNLETATSPLTNAGLFRNMSATPSDPTVVSAVAGTGAVAGPYSVNVSQVATA